MDVIQLWNRHYSSIYLFVFFFHNWMLWLQPYEVYQLKSMLGINTHMEMFSSILCYEEGSSSPLIEEEGCRSLLLPFKTSKRKLLTIVRRKSEGDKHDQFIFLTVKNSDKVILMKTIGISKKQRNAWKKLQKLPWLQCLGYDWLSPLLVAFPLTNWKKIVCQDVHKEPTLLQTFLFNYSYNVFPISLTLIFSSIWMPQILSLFLHWN